jgi:DNA-binding SARP family transcriptional activator
VGNRRIPPAAWKRRSARRVLEILALQPGHQLHREEIEELLWPDLTPASALNSLHAALHAARHVLEPELLSKQPSSYLRLLDGVVGLVPESVWVDIDEAERLAREALGSRDPARYGAALEALAGELLPEDLYEDWAFSHRDRLTGLRLRLTAELADALEASGRYAEAITWLERALERGSVHEDLHRRLMRLYLRTGSRHQAIRQYFRCREQVRRELDDEPEPETEALYREIVSSRTGPNGPPEGSDTVRPLPPALRIIPSAPLVAREEAHDFLRRGRDRVLEGQGALILISGEAGVGKTRLVGDFAREAHGLGLHVLLGIGRAEEGHLPYGPIVEAIDDWAVQQSARVREDVSERIPELVTLVPGLGVRSPTAAPAPSVGSDPTQLFVAVARLLSEIAAVAPVVLVLEDLHAADPDSLHLLHYLARTAKARPWLIIGTYRDHDLPANPDLGAVLREIDHQRLARHVGLLRLARAETELLLVHVLGGGVEQPVVDVLQALTLGNPLFVLELLSTMRERGTVAAHGGLWRLSDASAQVVPSSIQDLIEARVTRGGTPAHAVLELAAVVGMDVPFDLLREVRPVSESAIVDALDWALRGQILEERPTGYAFRHPLFRAALYERTSVARRTVLHAAVMRALERIAPDQVEALAFHAVRGGLLDEAVVYLERAGDAARLTYANEAAESLYRELLRIVPVTAGSHPGAEARIREKLGAVLTTLSRYGEALEELRQAAKLHEAEGDAEGLADAVARLGRVHYLQGTAEEGLQQVRPLVDRMEQGSGLQVSPERASQLYVALAQLCSATRFAEALEAAEKGLELAQDERTRVEAGMQKEYALQQLGRLQEALAVIEEILPVAERVGDLDLLQRTLTRIAAPCEELGLFQRSLGYRERALALAERIGNPAMIATSSASLGGNLMWLGRWEEAWKRHERVLAVFESLQSPSYTNYCYIPLATMARWYGDLTTARSYAQKGLALAQRVDNIEALCFAHADLAELDLLDGRPDAAVARLEPMLARLNQLDPDSLYVGWISPYVARFCLAAGDLARAEEASARGLRLACERANRMTLRFAYWVRGMVLTTQGRWAEAEMCFQDGLALTREMRVPQDEGFTLREYGRMLVLRGEPERGRELMEEALAIFRRLGARLDAEFTEEALAAL